MRSVLFHLSPTTYRRVIEIMQSFNLDFDDSIQYVAAERDDLTIVSLDSDFDRTPRGRKTPAQVVAELCASP